MSIVCRELSEVDAKECPSFEKLSLAIVNPCEDLDDDGYEEVNGHCGHYEQKDRKTDCITEVVKVHGIFLQKDAHDLSRYFVTCIGILVNNSKRDLNFRFILAPL